MAFSHALIGFHKANKRGQRASELCENQLTHAKMPYVRTSHEQILYNTKTGYCFSKNNFLNDLFHIFFKYIRKTAYFICLFVFLASESLISLEMSSPFSKQKAYYKLPPSWFYLTSGQGRSKLNNWGGRDDIHIFVFTDHKNNRFQKKSNEQNTHIWISAPPPPPQLSSLLRPW